MTAVLRFNHGFAEDLNAGRTAPLQILVDGTDSNTASIALSYAMKIATAYSQNGFSSSGSSGRWDRPGKTGTVELRSRAWFNENLESRNFFVPGVLVIVVALSTLLLDQHGRGAGEGDRHDGADHGHADHAGRVHSGQDRAVRADRIRRSAAGDADRRVLVRGADPRQLAVAACWARRCS